MISLIIRQSRLEVNYRIFMKGKNGKSLQEIFKQQLEDIEVIREQTELLHKRMMYVEKSLNKSYQKCGIVKYDAFKEIGGQLSFAYALLNDSNTGFVMNCIHSREGSYTYIKDIIRGECELTLCDEEAEAVKIAIESTTAQPVTTTSSKTPNKTSNKITNKLTSKLPNKSSK
jgi:hypothetical protein